MENNNMNLNQGIQENTRNVGIEQTHGNNNKNIIIIALVLIILGLVGFIAYDKFIQNEIKSETGTNIQGKDCNCPKCEECKKCDNNSTPAPSNFGENVTSIKKLSLTTSNQVIKIGGKSYKIRLDNEGVLIVDDKEISAHGYPFSPLNVYLTDKFLFATISGQYKETLSYAISEKGIIDINDNDSQMDNFRIVDGYLHADGGTVQFGGDEIDWKEGNLIITFINNTLTVSSFK